MIGNNLILIAARLCHAYGHHHMADHNFSTRSLGKVLIYRLKIRTFLNYILKCRFECDESERGWKMEVSWYPIGWGCFAVIVFQKDPDQFRLSSTTKESVGENRRKAIINIWKLKLENFQIAVYQSKTWTKKFYLL